jgi:hypothetical protein
VIVSQREMPRTTKTIGVCDATTLAEVPRGPVSFDETHNAVANDYLNQVKKALVQTVERLGILR